MTVREIIYYINNCYIYFQKCFLPVQIGLASFHLKFLHVLSLSEHLFKLLLQNKISQKMDLKSCALDHRTHPASTPRPGDVP